MSESLHKLVTELSNLASLATTLQSSMAVWSADVRSTSSNLITRIAGFATLNQ